jgi:D-3-phosphoglycerate dehydrogenase / 2-oxoglutarate reductase
MKRPRVTHVGTYFGPSGYELERAASEQNGGDFVLSEAETEENLIADCADSKIVIVESSKLPISGRFIERLTTCLMIGRAGTGVDNVDLAAATRERIVVSNAAAYCSEEVSDHAVALILACARRVVLLDRHVHAGGWGDTTYAERMRRLQTQTVGLIGFGRIARLVARKLSGFRLHVAAYDPLVPAHEAAARGVEMLPLEQLLEKADYVSIHVPITESTQNLLSADRLSFIKSGAYLINTSRGGLIDEQALVTALRGGRLAGAALDVTSIEPLPSGSVLRELPNVILTPHFAAESIDANCELHRNTASSIAAILQGYWPEFPVNPQVMPREPLLPWKDFSHTQSSDRENSRDG